MAKRKFSAKRMIAAIKQAKGVKAHAAEILGCDRHTVENYIKDMATVREAYLEEVGKSYDISYVSMLSQVKRGHWPAIRYYLDNFDPEEKRRQYEDPEDGQVVYEEQIADDDGRTAVTLRVVRDR